MIDDLPTPCIVIDGPIARANVARMAHYARGHGLALRPHAKTHKSILLGKLQIDAGAVGLTVAKPGEANVMAEVSGDILMAYPAVDSRCCADLARLAQAKTIRVAIDSTHAADQLSAAAQAAGSTIGILVDLDVGHHRTGVQNAADALVLAQRIEKSPGLRLDGILFFPGHITAAPAAQRPALDLIGQKLADVIGLWGRSGLAARIVSGGSTPTAFQSHFVKHLTEIRPGTYVFNDMNCVRGGSATLDQCAARIIATVVSTSVPGQVVLDAGSKTLTSDPCGPALDSGYGYVCEFPQARIAKLSEEHAQVDVTLCSKPPSLGQRVSIIPNHICPCVNLQDNLWWKDEDGFEKPMKVDARGKVY